MLESAIKLQIIINSISIIIKLKLSIEKNLTIFNFFKLFKHFVHLNKTDMKEYFLILFFSSFISINIASSIFLCNCLYFQAIITPKLLF